MVPKVIGGVEFNGHGPQPLHGFQGQVGGHLDPVPVPVQGFIIAMGLSIREPMFVWPTLTQRLLHMENKKFTYRPMSSTPVTTDVRMKEFTFYRVLTYTCIGQTLEDAEVHI